MSTNELTFLFTFVDDFFKLFFMLPLAKSSAISGRTNGVGKRNSRCPKW